MGFRSFFGRFKRNKPLGVNPNALQPTARAPMPEAKKPSEFEQLEAERQRRETDILARGDKGKILSSEETTIYHKLKAKVEKQNFVKFVRERTLSELNGLSNQLSNELREAQQAHPTDLRKIGSIKEKLGIVDGKISGHWK